MYLHVYPQSLFPSTDSEIVAAFGSEEKQDSREFTKENSFLPLRKSLEAKKTKRKLVLGMDVGLEESCTLSLCTLVGRIAYRSRCSSALEDWMKLYWLPFLGYCPELINLPRGWLGFMFKNPEDSEKVLNSFWSYDGGSLMLKRWRLSFNPSTEYFSYRHIWVLLPSFPLQLWNRKAMEAVGNSLGRFLKIEEGDLLSPNKKMEKILVEIDIHGGLLDVLEIEWRGLALHPAPGLLRTAFLLHPLPKDWAPSEGLHTCLWFPAG
jgi:hypothetical protein